MPAATLSARYIGRCDQLKAQDLHDYDDSERSITARTFRRHIGADAYQDLEIQLGYRDLNGRIKCKGLTLASDWAVSFGKGRWRDRPCVCCHWSAFHHIWLIAS